jgi:5'-nucleotidase
MADGSALRDDARYTLVLNDFLATGGDGLGLGAAALRTEVLDLVDLDALVRYLRRAPQPVRGPSDIRIIATGPAR